MKVLNLDAAKSMLWQSKDGKITVEDDFFISREARLFFEANNINVEVVRNTEKGGAAAAYTAKHKKPEHMTSLNGEKLVVKNHPRIKLRGKMDSLQADILRMEILAGKYNETALIEDLEELLNYSRQILAAEVLEKPVDEIRLFGLDEGDLRYISQHPDKYFGIGHVPPEFSMGEICVELNALRTRSRETELAAIDAFCDPPRIERTDIIKALNRMSSAIYIIYCKYLQQSRMCDRAEG